MLRDICNNCNVMTKYPWFLLMTKTKNKKQNSNSFCYYYYGLLLTFIIEGNVVFQQSHYVKIMISFSYPCLQTSFHGLQVKKIVITWILEILEAMSLVSFVFQMMKQEPTVSMQGHTTMWRELYSLSPFLHISPLHWQGQLYSPPRLQGFFLICPLFSLFAKWAPGLFSLPLGLCRIFFTLFFFCHVLILNGVWTLLAH